MQERYERDGFALLGGGGRVTGAFLGNVGPVRAARRRRGRGGARAGRSPRRGRARGSPPRPARACRDWVFATLDVDHVVSLIMPANLPRAASRENLGMTVWTDTMWGSPIRSATASTGWTGRRRRVAAAY